MEWIYESALILALMFLVFHVWNQRKKEKEVGQEKERLEEYLVELISCYRTYRNVEEAMEEAEERVEKKALEKKKRCGVQRKEKRKQLPYAVLVNRLCDLTGETGDRKQEGTSLFLKNLSYIREELREDILFRKHQSYCFLGLTKLCILPFFMIPFIALWAGSVLDALAAYYQGGFSIITTTICFGITVMSYELVAWCEMPDLIKEIDYKVVRKMLQIPWISANVNRKVQRQYHHYLLKNEKLKLLQGYGNVREFILKKRCSAVCYSIFGIFFLGMLWRIELWQISDQLHFPEMYTLLETDEIQYIEEKMQEQFQNLCKGTSTLDEVKEVWREEKEVGDTVFLQLEQSYLTWQQYRKKIVILFWAIPFGVWGYIRPEILLRLRQESVKQERMEEVRRLQTVFLVLAQNKDITVEQILEEMEESAVLFRKALQETVDHFSYGRKAEIERLREEIAFAPMGRICDTLLACEDIGVEDACSGLEEERYYTLKQQKQERMEQMKERAALGKILAYVPFLMVLALKLILPFVVEGLSQLQLYSDGMSNYF